MARATQKAEKPGPGWLTKKEMCAVFDVSPSNFEATYRRYAAPDATREIGGKLFYHARRVIEAWARQQKTKPVQELDPLLAGGDSPALEEYRRHRARLAKIDADERERLSAPRSELEPVLMQSAGVMRRAGERLARRFGNEAAEIHNEAVEQLEETIRSLCSECHEGHDDAVGGGDEDAPAPHDARVR